MINQEILDKIKPGAKVKVFTTGGSVSSKGEGTVSTFEGLVIARKQGSGTGATFTVRTILAGVGVEKVFPIHAPTISKVQIISSPNKIHRAKLYFVRETSGKRIRKKLGVSV